MMRHQRMTGALWVFMLLFLYVTPLAAEGETGTAPAPTPGTLTVLLKPLNTFKGMTDVDKLAVFLADFINMDARYTVTGDASVTAAITVEVTFTRTKNGIGIAMNTDTVGIRKASHSAELSGRQTLAAIQSEMARGIRLTIDYKPAQRGALVRIVGSSDDDESYGEMVEDAVFAAIQQDYRRIEANPQKLPVADDNMPALMKGEAQLLNKIRDAGVALLIVGTVKVPKAVNIGGATQNLFRGKALVTLKIWDLERQHQVANIELELTGEGSFSGLIFRLFNGAGARAAEMVRQDLGYPVEAAKP